MTADQLKAIRAVCDAITDAVAVSGPLGAPQGVLYAALMAHGCSLNQFQSLLRGLVAAGKVRVDGLLVYLTDAEARKRGHYWTGHGTLCSLDNENNGRRTDDEATVTCPHCLQLLAINQQEVAR